VVVCIRTRGSRLCALRKTIPVIPGVGPRGVARKVAIGVIRVNGRGNSSGGVGVGVGAGTVHIRSRWCRARDVAKGVVVVGMSVV